MTSNIVRIFDYQRPTHTIESVYLDVNIGDQIEVISHLKVQSNGGADWELNREFFETLALNVDGQPWQDLSENAQSVTLHNLPDRFEFSAHTRFDPAANTHLSGIYLSDGIICSQCEAEGFRRITYFPDRPDVMSLFTVKITADQSRYPLLLSNGEEIAHETHADGTHSTTWHDPFPKPCYLFALVAGD
ncbi:MAG: aminopeptidase N, partial [Gammaproteobacteria bacterium]|nr:aminopeptidase N [Gammaproteobacteria bacterium]